MRRSAGSGCPRLDLDLVEVVRLLVGRAQERLAARRDERGWDVHGHDERRSRPRSVGRCVDRRRRRVDLRRRRGGRCRGGGRCHCRGGGGGGGGGGGPAPGGGGGGGW